MEISEGSISGVRLVRLAPIADVRGAFMRTYDVATMREAGLHRDWVQENQSRNERKGILRGLHFQYPPAAETKLVRCVRGAIFDVYVDLRRGSPTLGRWGGNILTDENHLMLFIPKGFAHGYCTLTEISIVQYKVDHAYTPEREGGIRWNDPDIGIEWPLDGAPQLSDRDGRHSSLKDLLERTGGLVI